MKTISTLFGSVLALQTMMTVILMLGLVSLGWGQTAGPNNAGTGANVDKGDTNWSNPGNITTAGTPYATANIGTGTSDYLRGTSYGFSIPNGATIDGIEVTINRSGTQGYLNTGCFDEYVYIVKGGTIQTTQNKANDNRYPTNLGTATYGGPNDLWGVTWTPAQINDSNFGIVLSTDATTVFTSCTATVDYMRITVYYTTCSNEWVGTTTSTAWNVASNWLCGSVPAPGEDIIFSTSAANDLILDQDRTIGSLTNNSGKALVIPTGRTLTIGGTATTNSADRIVLESAKGLANGALIFTNPASNTNVQATVEFASKSQPASGTWPRAWQYFGVPVSGKSLTDLFGTNVQGSIYGGDAAVNTILRKYEESQTIPGNLQEKWANLNLTDVLLPYYGYEITQPQTVFENADSSPYQFKGPLVTEATKTLNLTSTTGVYASGSFILANPYAAPIFYDNIVDGDFENLQKVFYIFNTGSRKQWEDANGESELGEQPGTYTSIPLFVTGEIEKFQIPSMQGFLVAADNLSLASSFKFRYETVYRPSTVTTPNEPMLIQRAENDKKPKNKPDKDAKPVITMDVIGENSSDRLYLIKADEATKAYDDGWDGFKFISPNVAQLYAFDQDGNRLQVNSDSDLNDTYIGFRSGGESSYKLRFRFTNLDGVYSTVFLEDLATGMTEIVTDGMILNFSPAAGSAEKRFRITVEAAKGKSTGLDNSKLIKIHVASKRIVVDNNTDENGMLTVYDVTGTPIFEKEFVPGRNDIMINLKKGSYIIEAKTASERTVVKSI